MKYLSRRVARENVSQRTCRRPLCLLLLLLLLSGCGSLFPGPSPSPTPANTIQPLVVPHQPYRVMQYCLDATGSYPSKYFHQANAAVADWIDSAVQPNQDGFVVYVTIITYNSFRSESTVLTIVVPALPADPPMPTPLPTPTPTQNYMQNAQYTDAVNETNQQHLLDWRQTLQQRHQQLQHIRTAVRVQTDKLRALTPPADPGGTDIYGCVKRASERFQGVHGVKLLVLATDLENNSWAEWTPDYPLAGAQVMVIWHYCVDAGECDRTDAQWRQTFQRAGATSFESFDPAESVTISNPLTP